jgi:hypothetical protein
VSHRERRITVYRRSDARWLMRVAVSGGRVAVESIGAELEVDEIYAASTIAEPPATQPP